MPLVRLPVFELHPLIIGWMKRNYLWVPDFVDRAVELEDRRYPCLCLEDELFLQDSLESKISAYLPVSEARKLLKFVARLGRVRVPPEMEVDHLVWIELIQRHGNTLSARPTLLSPQVQHVLQI